MHPFGHNLPFHSLGYTKVLTRWIPHVLTDGMRFTLVSIWQSLFSCLHSKEFLGELTTANESCPFTIGKEPSSRRSADAIQNGPSYQAVAPLLTLGFARNIIFRAAPARTHSHCYHLQQSPSETGEHCSGQTAGTSSCPSTPQYRS